jgi:hypothetical protein
MKMRIIKYKDIINKNPIKSLLQEYIEKFGENDISLNDLLQLGKYRYWILENLLTLEDEKAVIDSGSAYWCYTFAKYVKGADVKRLQKVVIEDGNADFCYLFAKTVKGANVKRLEKIYKQKGNKNEKIRNISRLY